MNKRNAALTSIALALVAGSIHAQTLVIAPNPIALSVQAGGSPVATSLSFTSSDNGATSISFTLVPGSSWLSVSQPAQGNTYKTPATVTVTVTPAALQAGAGGCDALLQHCAGTLSVYSSQFQSVTVNVTVSSISVSPTSINLGAYQAGSTVYPAAQTLAVAGANGNFTLSKAAADTWYTAAAYGNPLSGVLISFNQAAASSLVPSSTPLSGTLTITPGANNSVPVTVPISLTVTASPQVTVSPASLVFNWQYLGTNNLKQQTLTLTSNATQAVNFTVSAAGINWITLPASNPTTIPAGGSTQVVVQVAGDSQPQGASNGSLLINLPGGGALFSNGTTTLTLPVQLNVSPYPLLYASPASLTFSYQFGSLTTPMAQAVTPTTSGAPNQQLQYNVSTPSKDAWISTAPPGTLTTGAGSFNVIVNVSGLAPGVYNSSVTLTPVPNGSGQAPLNIPVTLTVSFPNALLVNNSPAPPPLVFPYQVGQSAPAPQTVTLSSSNGAPLNYVVTPPSAAWVQVNGGNSGFTGVTDQTSFTVSINPAGVPSPPPAGYQDATISVAATDLTGAAVNTIPVDVRLFASTTPQLIVSPPGPLQFFTYPNSPTYPLSSTATINLTGTSPLPGDAVTIASVTKSVTNQASTGNWLGGTTPGPQTPTSFTVNADQLSTTTMPTGAYSGSVTIVATGPNTLPVPDGPIAIPVSFVINSAKGSIITPQPDGSMSFTQTAGGQVPPAQTVQVNTDGPSLPFQAVVNTGLLNWLSVAAPTGPTPGSFRVNADATNLTTGVYKGAIYVTIPNAAGSPFRIPVTFTVNGGSISASPQSLSFTQILGGGVPAAQTVQITSTPSSVSYTTSVSVTSPAGGNWLAASITAGNGFTPGTVTVTTTPGNLPAGTYQGNVTITSVGTSGSPINIPVMLTVQQATITASVTQLTFNQLAGGAAPQPQTVAVSSTPGPIPFTVSATTANGVAWLTASAGSSGSTGTTPGNIQVSVNAGSLTPGPYTGYINITSAGATNSPIIIPVLLNVGTAAMFSVTPQSLTFSGLVGQATTPQTVTLTSTAAAAFTVATSTKDNGTWLTASPASGTAGSSPVTLTISANTQNLAANSYSGSVTISSAAILTPVTINVSLTVSTIPTPVVSAVDNAASYQAGSVSPGENIVLFGTGIGPAPLVQTQQLTAAGKFPTTLGNTQVLFDGIAAPILYASSTQTSVMVPYEIGGRAVTNIQVLYYGVPSASLPYNVAQAVPGIYTQNSQGFGPGSILNQDYTINGPGNPAPKGSTVAVYMTGEGATNPASTTGAIANTTGNPLNKPVLPVTATIGGQTAVVQYYGSAPGIVYGVMQVNITIPAGTPTGPQALVINVGNNPTQANVTVAVQ